LIDRSYPTSQQRPGGLLVVFTALARFALALPFSFVSAHLSWRVFSAKTALPANLTMAIGAEDREILSCSARWVTINVVKLHIVSHAPAKATGAHTSDKHLDRNISRNVPSMLFGATHTKEINAKMLMRFRSPSVRIICHLYKARTDPAAPGEPNSLPQRRLEVRDNADNVLPSGVGLSL
jgi:hypothetical protein